MMKRMFLVQRKQDEYIKRLASQTDMLTKNKKMVETQIAP